MPKNDLLAAAAVTRLRTGRLLSDMQSSELSPPIPRATYRLQLTKDFTFRDAAAVAPYLGSLGISHVYLSPVLKARPGSTHGYDTVDHTILNPELGTRSEFEAMAAAFRNQGLGIILDIVPNHMGVGGADNRLWLDVLKWGQKSQYADWFDIDWNPPEPSLRGKILVPFLGVSYGEALEQGKLELRHDEAPGEFAVWAEGTHKLPICPDTYASIGDASRVGWFNTPEGRPDLKALIDRQHWRIARFSVAADEMNYRRFFINSDLAGIRVERDDVFDHVHALTFELVEAGLVDGLRVDHIDGLYDPKAYCLRLREKCPRPVYLVVEKILAGHEQLRSDWGVDGTTGYEFAGAVTRLLTDSRAEEAMTELYEHFTGRTVALADVERSAKRDIVDFEMNAELERLANILRSLAKVQPTTGDLSRSALRTALKETVAALPVYRTYVDDAPLDDRDARNVRVAIAHARHRAAALDPAVFDFLELVMTAELGDENGYDRGVVLDCARRIQQFTGPVMAKGLEDTALYRYNRLISLSDVGEKPDQFSSSVAAFHDWVLARQREFPNGMLATSTHDTKRGEDARARITALSQNVRAWEKAVRRWDSALAADGVSAIEANDRYYFYQLLLGSWPAVMPKGGSVNAEQLASFTERLQGAMLKSVREERLRTNWLAPRSEYEDAVRVYIGKAMSHAAFLADFRTFEATLAPLGMRNGLIETVLKLTVPGVPDFYQGAELWEQSMVDPDNRRPIDFELRKSLPARGENDDGPIGRIKQHLIVKLLVARRVDPQLFISGSYEPLAAPPRELAFMRRREGRALFVTFSFDWPEPVLTDWPQVLGRVPRYELHDIVDYPHLRVAIGTKLLQAAP